MVLQDAVERYKGSVIQHGSYNDRIYLIKLASEPSSSFPDDLIALAKAEGYSKIFAKTPERHFNTFLSAGFKEEARIPGFYHGKGAAVFSGFYLNDTRAEESDKGKMKEILKIALNAENNENSRRRASGFTLRRCNQEDAMSLAEIYKTVFPSYPFPIHDPDYVRETMSGQVVYFCIESDGQLVAASSAEMDTQSSNVEMTDFATLPDWRGNGFAQSLLSRMEDEMKEKGIIKAYTIARAMSAGMNITFSKSGYQFGGRLKNNTNISGQIESMNIWYKTLID